MKATFKAIISRETVSKKGKTWFLELIADSPKAAKVLDGLRSDFGVWRDRFDVFILWNSSGCMGLDKATMRFHITEGPDLQNPSEAEEVLKLITDEQIAELKKQIP
jgi:hypothetical protein